ncbi:hypothetical protein FACS1894180_2320 [Bacteroidia bacterium]|nr:hypothetical protein FACS1894180_2320 [Bacteroidia bacterium]
MKTIKKYFYLLTAITVICFMLPSCVKLKTLTISQEHKDYFLFDIGSYWIFQDSATFEIDSMVVTDIQYSIGTIHGDLYSREYETYSVNLDVFKDNIKIKSTSISASAKQKINVLLNIGINDTGYGYFGGNVGQTYYFASTMGIKYKAFYEYYFLQDSLMVYDVKQFSYDDIEDAYWARDVGLIRFEWNDTNAMLHPCNLIRYNNSPYNK